MNRPTTRRPFHKRSLLQKIDAHRVIPPNIIMVSSVEGKNVVEKCIIESGITSALRKEWSKINQVEGNFTRDWTSAGDSASPHVHMSSTWVATVALFVLKLSRLQDNVRRNRKNYSVVSNSDNVLHFICKSTSESLQEEWRGTSNYLEVQCDVSTVSEDLWSLVSCWCRPTVFYQIQAQDQIQWCRWASGYCQCNQSLHSTSTKPQAGLLHLVIYERALTTYPMQYMDLCFHK